MASAKSTKPDAPESVMANLIRAGMELGVTEAARRFSDLIPAAGTRVRSAAQTGANWAQEFAMTLQKALAEEPDTFTQIVKEVWSRGGAREKRIAAEALGKGLGRLLPHRAVTAAHDLARMARSGREAEWIGATVIAPILEFNPALTERVKSFLHENEVYVRRAALAGIMVLTVKERKWSKLAIEALFIVAEMKEKEIQQAVRSGLKRVTAMDPKATARALSDWVRSDPTRERVAMARSAVKAAPTKARAAIEKAVFSGLDRIVNGSEIPAGKRAQRVRG